MFPSIGAEFSPLRAARPGLLLLCLATVAAQAEWRGEIGLQGRWFPQEPLDPRQTETQLSASLELEFYTQWDERRQTLVFKPFARIDSADAERSHWDIRELQWIYAGDGWEARAGVGKVYWGVTEAWHLVDIINQTDLVEDPDGEDKLGQPLLKLSLERDWGVLDLFLLPGFRERTFPGSAGRLRSHPEVDTNHPRYQSAAAEHHVDLAVRWSQVLGDWDVGLSHFHGTGREPTLMPALVSGNQVLIPYYPQIDQTSLDLQATKGDWLWKLEAIYRSGQGDDYYAATGGFEYTFVGMFESAADLGVLGEVMYDQRGDEATSMFNNDLFAALRWTPNDEQNTELLAGVIYDWETGASMFNLEFSRRIGHDYTLSAQARSWFDVPPDDTAYGVSRDDYLELELTRYF